MAVESGDRTGFLRSCGSAEWGCKFGARAELLWTLEGGLTVLRSPSLPSALAHPPGLSLTPTPVGNTPSKNITVDRVRLWLEEAVGTEAGCLYSGLGVIADMSYVCTASLKCQGRGLCDPPKPPPTLQFQEGGAVWKAPGALKQKSPLGA